MAPIIGKTMLGQEFGHRVLDIGHVCGVIHMTQAVLVTGPDLKRDGNHRTWSSIVPGAARQGKPA
jgi:hypothetical protein